MPEWLIERGIAETRAALIEGGEIVEARVELDGVTPAGSVIVDSSRALFSRRVPLASAGPGGVGGAVTGSVATTVPLTSPAKQPARAASEAPRTRSLSGSLGGCPKGTFSCNWPRLSEGLNDIKKLFSPTPSKPAKKG